MWHHTEEVPRLLQKAVGAHGCRGAIVVSPYFGGNRNQRAEFVVPFSSRSCSLTLKLSTLFSFEWAHCHISLKWWSFHPIPLLEQKRCHLMTFTWRLESERTRGKRNHKFHALNPKTSIVLLCSWMKKAFLFSIWKKSAVCLYCKPITCSLFCTLKSP